ncbi:MAG: cupin domain-containing protein [Sulfurovum sp.]|jgi:anti-sigma factor ChrR (cupin superfamily)
MNEDYEKKAFINTNSIDWSDTKNSGIFKKLLSKKNAEETYILKLEENTKYISDNKINSVEIFVLNGTYINEYGEFRKGTYLNFEKEDQSSVSSKEGCVVFKKVNYNCEKEQIIIDTKKSTWSMGHGNLEVLPLQNQTALVKWPKNEKFIPHKHWGGEEIFVLSGTFIDEHGIYPKHSWIRSPHLSHHHPYVEDETIIYVKTGHL